MSNPTITRRTAEHLIYQGDDLARMNELLAAIDEVTPTDDGGPNLMGDQAVIAERLEEYNAFIVEAEARAVKVGLKALDRKVWRSIVDQHPARPNVESDQRTGVNEDTFQEVLVPMCMTGPAFESDTDRTEFLDALSEGDFGSLYQKAFRLNRGAAVAPKALTVSDLMPKKEPT